MKKAFFWVAGLLAAASASAGDVYVLQFLGPVVQQAQSSCEAFRWRSEMVFHNAGESLATVRLLSVSNGSLTHNAQDLHIEPGRTVAGIAGSLGWHPDPQATLFVTRINVPDGVIFEARSEPTGLEYSLPCASDRLAPLHIRGAFPLPVIRALAPANTPQHFLSADLGHLANRAYATIYNAGDDAATALIRVYRECDEHLIATQSVAVAGNTVVSAALEGSYDACLNSWPVGRHVVITLDRPGFALVSAVDGDSFKKLSMSIQAGQTP
jgi:hypothetical protein